MTKEAYFQYKTKLLSKRAISVIEANHITCDTIAAYNFADFKSVKNCGNKTIFELTNLQKDINFILANPTLPLVLIDDRILKEYPLSFRGKRALASAGICDSISLHKFVVNKSKIKDNLHSIGEKTIRELCGLYDYLVKQYSNPVQTVKAIANSKGVLNTPYNDTALPTPDVLKNSQERLDNPYNDATLPTVEALCNEYKVSIKARKALSIANISDLSSLLIATKNPNLNFSSFYGFGRKTDAELQLFFDTISKEKVELYEKVFSVNGNPIFKKYLSAKSKALDDTLNRAFNEQIQEVSIQQRNLILSVYKSFFDVISKAYVVRLKHNSNTDNLLLQFRDNFNVKTEMFYDMTEQEVVLHNAFKLPYLNEGEQQFVRNFFLRKKRLPMFFLLCQSLKHGKRDTHIYSAKIGFLYVDPIARSEKFIDYSDGIINNIERNNLEQISEYWWLPKERIRQIWECFCNSDYVAKLPFVRENSWEAYPFLKSNYFSIDDIDFDNLVQEEHLPWDFSVFCYLCALIRKDFIVLRIARNRNGLFFDLSSGGHGVVESIIYPELYVYVYNTALSVFDFSNLIRYIDKETKKATMYDKMIVLNDLCLDTRFWYEKKADVNLIPQITEFAEKIISDILHIQLVVGTIQIKANRVNVKQFLYDYMLEKGQPVTINELLTALLSKYPDTTYTQPDQIRNFLLDKEMFVPMGRKSLYTLAGTSEYCGCLPDLVMHILTSSGKPLTRQEIFQKAHSIRPDSVYSSIRTTISTLLRENKVVLSDNGCIELPLNN